MSLGISLPLENFALKNMIPRGGLGVCRVSERIWSILWIYDDLIFLNYALLLLTVKYPMLTGKFSYQKKRHCKIPPNI